MARVLHRSASMTTRGARATVAMLALGVVLARWSTAATAEGERGAGPTAPRVSFLEGEVSFWRPGAEDWAPAKTNMPLAPGDELYAGDSPTSRCSSRRAPRARRR